MRAKARAPLLVNETNAKPWPGLPRHVVGGGRAHRLETTVSVAAFAGRLPQRRGLFVLVTGLNIGMESWSNTLTFFHQPRVRTSPWRCSHELGSGLTRLQAGDLQ
jgi:hypothetical protein